MATILVVDDEPKIARLLRDYLERAGFGVSVAHDGREALMRARTERPDLVILDLGLPALDGLDVTRQLRRDGDLPILMLTARDDEADRVAGLELGADDYVTKPFSPREVVARVRAILRRRGGPSGEEVIRVGPLEVGPGQDAGDGRRSAGRRHRHRVRAPRRAGQTARARLHPLPAPRRDPWHGLRVVRARDRRARRRTCAASSSRRRTDRACSSPSTGSATAWPMRDHRGPGRWTAARRRRGGRRASHGRQATNVVPRGAAGAAGSSGAWARSSCSRCSSSSPWCRRSGGRSPGC